MSESNNSVNDERPKNFITIKQGKLTKPDSKLVNYVFRLVTDDSAYKVFSDDPEKDLRSSGVNTDNIVIDTFREIVDQLRRRKSGLDSVFGKIATTSESTSSQSHSRTNFDNSSSSFWRYESDLGFWSERGTVTANSTGENSDTTTDFKKDGEGFHPGDILQHEIGLIFFPNQPLVAPELIDAIRSKLVEK